MSILKGSEFTEEHKEKIRQATLGRKNPYAPQNLGKYAEKGVMKGVPKPAGHGEKVRQARLGTHLSEETKQKISESRKGKSSWNKGIPHSKETKIKIGLKSKGRPRSEQWRAKHSKRVKGKGNYFWKGGLMLDPNYNAFHVRKRRLLKLNATGSHTSEEWEQLKKLYNNMCLACKRFEPEVKLTEDHIIPLSLGGTDNIENIQPLCQSCNSRKRIKDTNYKPQ